MSVVPSDTSCEYADGPFHTCTPELQLLPLSCVLLTVMFVRDVLRGILLVRSHSRLCTAHVRKIGGSFGSLGVGVGLEEHPGLVDDRALAAWVDEFRRLDDMAERADGAAAGLRSGPGDLRTVPGLHVATRPSR